MVTALDDRAAKLRGLHAGAEDFLTKPVDRVELNVRVRNLLRLKAYGDFYDEYSQRLEGEVSSRTADSRTDETLRAGRRAQRAGGIARPGAGRHRRVRHAGPDRLLEPRRRGHVRLPQRRGDRADQTTCSGPKAPSRLAAIEATLLRQGQWKGEAIHYTRDGMRLIVDSHCALQCDAASAPVRVLAIVSDVTGRKQADDRLLSLTERLAISTAVAKVGVWEWDLASNTLTWDATMFDIYGIPAGRADAL